MTDTAGFNWFKTHKNLGLTNVRQPSASMTINHHQLPINFHAKCRTDMGQSKNGKQTQETCHPILLGKLMLCIALLVTMVTTCHHDGQARWPKTCEIIRRLRPTTASRLSWKPWPMELDDSVAKVIFCGKLWKITRGKQNGFCFNAILFQ